MHRCLKMYELREWSTEAEEAVSLVNRVEVQRKGVGQRAEVEFERCDSGTAVRHPREQQE